MGQRVMFDAQGRLASVDSKQRVTMSSKSSEHLVTSNQLSFLRENEKKQGEKGWALYADSEKLAPLKFSNGKTQYDVVQEICKHIKQGKKIIFLHGVCGTGKSAIALHLAKELGKAAIVVPVKGLQKQYEQDYTAKKYVIKENGERLKIAMITGRENHDSLFFPGKSCADPMLPDIIKITEKNYSLLRDYYLANPYITRKQNPQLAQLKRMSIAPANPYWSPIAPADVELPLRDAKKITYKGLHGRDFIFYHRKAGCSYYDQYLAYHEADVIIFNAAKYKIETALERRPATAVDIIDEADDFLDSFAAQEELNLTRLQTALHQSPFSDPDALVSLEAIVELLKLEEKNKRALGVQEHTIYPLRETQFSKIFDLVDKAKALQAELLVDELHYGNKLVEAVEQFKTFSADTYVTFRYQETDLYMSLVTTNLSQQLKELTDKSNALVFMSGTLHSKEVLRDVFGISDYVLVEAETMQPGSIEIQRTGTEFDCKYETFKSGKKTRKEYLGALHECITRAPQPTLIHVNAFEDLPTFEEQQSFALSNCMIREVLRDVQSKDSIGKEIQSFKEKKQSRLFSTKCSRGIDFPGDQCKSIIFTKYPNPNIQDIFWKVLQKTHATYFWEFYQDRARREFLQRIYRGLRSPSDSVTVLSPDTRVLEAVKQLQRKL